MGVAITPAEFVARFSEFASVPVALTQDVIDEVVYFLRPYSVSGAYRILQLYLVAHMVSIQVGAQGGDATASNPATSKAVGSVSESLDVNSGGTSSTIVTQWNSTSYGQMFYQYLMQARYEITPYALI